MDELTLNSLFRLDGKRALVTGGSKGLGRVMAEALALAGADVAVVSRNREACEQTAQEIAHSTGRQTFGFPADVANSASVDLAMDAIDDSFGAIDILINNAGINVRGLSSELSEQDWDDVIGINLKAPFLVSRRLAPKMAERGWGRIINLGSILSSVALAGRAPYCSAKAGVVNLTRVLALEYADKGVTVNAVCPGPFGTEMNKPLLEDPEKYKAFVAKIPLGRWGEMHEIAGPVLFLASPGASFVTGTTLTVDGGWTAQ